MAVDGEKFFDVAKGPQGFGYVPIYRTITDFASGIDVMEISASIFTAFSGQVGQKMGVDGSTLIYDNLTGALSYDADGVGAAAAINFVIVGSIAHPIALGSDFLVVA